MPAAGSDNKRAGQKPWSSRKSRGGIKAPREMGAKDGPH